MRQFQRLPYVCGPVVCRELAATASMIWASFIFTPEAARHCMFVLAAVFIWIGYVDEVLLTEPAVGFGA
ncbi:MAG: hypothetical protein EOO81_05010 [Oxalobacteraceae bacterium]|nr:MAG: hypothetical protein EOO81_05010 [Oxalobacteraceae bacterium]